MIHFFANEIIYFSLLMVLGYSVKKIFKLSVKGKTLVTILLLLVTLHFIISLSVNLFGRGEIWFPFFVNVTKDFPNPNHDYDIQNFMLAMVSVYFVNGFIIIWCVARMLRMFGKSKER